MIAAPQPAMVPYQTASLYVGDLHVDATENTLFEKFSVVGPVASIRVCRDSVTRRSLGYAYVNFHNVQDAERALDTMNFTEIMGKPCRIMWSQRDPSLRRTGAGNIFVRNLAPSVDNKGLYDTFSVFGNILSCKVVTDDKGVSKGYGYVHFETAEAAQDAISKFDGMMIDDIEVKVIPFVRKQDRSTVQAWTNIYLKHFPLSYSEEDIKRLVSPFGEVISVFLSRDEEGKSKGFAFVNFNDHEAAEKAVSALHNTSLSGGEGEEAPLLYASRAMKKAERERELRRKQESYHLERIRESVGKNLYVKNISETVTDEAFVAAFSVCGQISSAKIMRDRDSGVSRGFGFVCYERAEDASRAVSEMQNVTLDGKPLFVALYQKKEQRRAQLAANYAPHAAGGMGRPFPGSNPAGAPFVYMGPGQPGAPQGPYGQGRPFQQYIPRGNRFNNYRGGPQGGSPGQGYNPQGFGGQGYPRGPRGGPGFGPGGVPPQGYGGPGAQGPGRRGVPGPQGPGVPPQGPLPGAPQGYGPGAPRGVPNPMGGPQGQMGQPRGVIPGGMPPRGMYPGQPGGVPGGVPPGQMLLMPGAVMQYPNMNMFLPRPGVPGQGGMPVQGVPQGVPNPAGPGGVQFTAQARNASGLMPMPGQPMGVVPPQPGLVSVPQGGQVDFSELLLKEPDPARQKNLIGERLYPLILQYQPELAGKITGMLLEMDNGELLNLLESPEALAAKVEEAMTVLRNHSKSQQGM